MTKRANGIVLDKSLALQTVFRIKGTKARSKPIGETGELTKGSSNTRRSHKKSRSGCQNCKLRRVKCDENKVGGCLKCRHHGIDCDYLTASQPEVEDNSYSTNTPSTRSTSVKVDTSSAAPSPTNLNALALTRALRSPTPLSYDLPSDITPYWQTLCHFELFTCPTITSIDGRKIFETSVLAIANDTDYLMHAILGTAAAHLAWNARLSDAPFEQRRHRQAEAYHWQRAVSLFRKEVNAVQQRPMVAVDALISTCMLLGIHSYFVSQDHDALSFVWTPRENRLDALSWLRIQSGFAVLLRSVGGRAALSVWLEIFMSAVPSEKSSPLDFNVTEGLFRDFLDICAIDEGSTPINNPYFTAVEDLFALLQMASPTMASFVPLMAFMGRLVGRFQSLLVELDPAAMLIVAHWLALMERLQLWWIYDRTRRECTAIVTYLKATGDTRVLRMLEIPAQAMNIDLIEIA